MNQRMCVTFASLALLAGCSGDSCWSGNCGGSASTGGGGGLGGSGLMEVTEENALSVLREAWYAATVAAEVPLFVVQTGVGDTSGGLASIGQGLSQPHAKAAFRNNVYVDPFGPTTYNCPVSGTFTVTGDVTDPNTVTAGDSISYSSSACNSGLGYTVDGSHSIDVTAIDGDVATGDYEQAQDMLLTDFRAESSTGVTTINGDHSAIIDSRPLNAITTTFVGNSLTITEQGVTVSVNNFIGFETYQTADPFNYSFDAAGTANSTAVQGSFDFIVDETFSSQGGNHPSDGILSIIGKDNSTARIGVNDAANIYVQVDANASGNYESTVEMTWDEFLGTAVASPSTIVGLPNLADPD